MTTRPGYVWDATTSEWVEIGQAAVVAPVAYQASEPSSPATGDIWIDSDDKVARVYDGTAWQQLASAQVEEEFDTFLMMGT
jgi:hypothetical protein